MASESESVLVGMRMRPMVGHEKGQKPCFRITGDQIDILIDNLSEDDRKSHQGDGPFVFDIVMDSSIDTSSPNYCDNSKCYDLIGYPLVKEALKGYNTCLFCYGQTGTGKTATIMGYENLGRGLLPRVLGEICDEADRMRSEGSEVSLTVRMLEVYNEDVKDLLVDRAKWDDLKIKTMVLPTGVTLKGASEASVNTLDDCLNILDLGTKRKTIAATKMNPTSSRGHMVFELIIAKSGGPDLTKLNSEMYFADLAGHENIKTTQVTGPRLGELRHINSSLMHLQRAISAMAKSSGKKKQKVNYAPFRNSELTLLLANGLIGNSKASVIVTLSPAAAHFDTSYDSIEFALEVKGITLDVSANVAADPVAHVKILQAEVAELKQQLAAAQASAGVPASPTSNENPKSERGAALEESQRLKELEAVEENLRLKERVEQLTKENESLQLQLEDATKNRDGAAVLKPSENNASMEHPLDEKLEQLSKQSESLQLQLDQSFQQKETAAAADTNGSSSEEQRLKERVKQLSMQNEALQSQLEQKQAASEENQLKEKVQQLSQRNEFLQLELEQAIMQKETITAKSDYEEHRLKEKVELLSKQYESLQASLERAIRQKDTPATPDASESHTSEQIPLNNNVEQLSKEDETSQPELEQPIRRKGRAAAAETAKNHAPESNPLNNNVELPSKQSEASQPEPAHPIRKKGRAAAADPSRGNASEEHKLEEKVEQISKQSDALQLQLHHAGIACIPEASESSSEEHRLKELVAQLSKQNQSLQLQLEQAIKHKELHAADHKSVNGHSQLELEQQPIRKKGRAAAEPVNNHLSEQTKVEHIADHRSADTVTSELEQLHERLKQQRNQMDAITAENETLHNQLDDIQGRLDLNRQCIEFCVACQVIQTVN